jgi:putative YhbY family RNA-binding protein
MNKILTPAERSALKARAHPLRPVVMIGNEGLSAAVLQEIDASLKAHELIKIKVDSDDQDERDDLMGTICANTGASAIQHIGKILVVFRERPDRGKQSRGEGGAARGRKRAGGGGGSGNSSSSSGSPDSARKHGAKAAGAGRKSGKSGQVWTKVRAQKPRRKPKPQQGQ